MPPVEIGRGHYLQKWSRLSILVMNAFGLSFACVSVLAGAVHLHFLQVQIVTFIRVLNRHSYFPRHDTIKVDDYHGFDVPISGVVCVPYQLEKCVSVVSKSIVATTSTTARLLLR